MRINQMVNDDYRSIFEDKAFIKQFSLLLSLIIAISLFLIYYSVDRIDRMRLPAWGDMLHTLPVSLHDVERKINGNAISLDILEDDFNDLAETDLQELEKFQSVASRSVHQNSVPVPVQEQTNTAIKQQHKKKAVIQITSAPISATKRRMQSTSIKTLRKKFYATHDVKYAISIAERLFTAKKYDKALKWSLIANELAPDSAKSWLLFAKAKLKMGKKRDAINVLEAYLQTYESPKVSRFLKQIKSS